jgi:hypothetical protein
MRDGKDRHTIRRHPQLAVQVQILAAARLHRRRRAQDDGVELLRLNARHLRQ